MGCSQDKTSRSGDAICKGGTGQCNPACTSQPHSALLLWAGSAMLVQEHTPYGLLPTRPLTPSSPGTVPHSPLVPQAVHPAFQVGPLGLRLRPGQAEEGR